MALPHLNSHWSVSNDAFNLVLVRNDGLEVRCHRLLYLMGCIRSGTNYSVRYLVYWSPSFPYLFLRFSENSLQTYRGTECEPWVSSVCDGFNTKPLVCSIDRWACAVGNAEYIRSFMAFVFGLIDILTSLILFRLECHENDQALRMGVKNRNSDMWLTRDWAPIDQKRCCCVPLQRNIIERQRSTRLILIHRSHPRSSNWVYTNPPFSIGYGCHLCRLCKTVLV